MELEFLKIKTDSGYMYGGDQSMFGRRASSSGCGMIAVCDMIMYLKNKELPLEEYKKFVTDFRDGTAYKHRLNLVGISPFRAVKMLRSALDGRGFDFLSRKKFRSAEDLAEFICDSVKNGMPVIVRVGWNFASLPYEIAYPSTGKISSGKFGWHYITVTGISDDGVLTFSSWGGKGIMRCSDLFTHFGITGGLIAAVDQSP